MTRKTPRVRVDRGQASTYASIGAQFLRAAETARKQDHWNAAGVLLVHACIAFADAAAIKLAGMKSTSENHQDAITLLREATSTSEGRDAALQRLRRVLEEKSRVSYGGEPFHRRDIEALFLHAARFCEWAERLLGR